MEEQYEPFDIGWFTQTRLVCASLTTTFFLLTFVLWFMLNGSAAYDTSTGDLPDVPAVQYAVFGVLSIASLPAALFLRRRMFASTQPVVDPSGRPMTGSAAARGRIGMAAIVGMAVPEVSVLLGFVLGFESGSWVPYVPLAAWGILGWFIMFPRPSQLRDWYERQSAGSALPEMNVGGPA